ncbi:MAG TPA: aspartate aminotransferase family protein, partial [Calditrichaeota bacterium]|nr:aspartate aminotransferase family protein [Calditrichota bacterium]
MQKSTSPQKRKSIEQFRRYVSSGKVQFFEKYDMDFVMGHREGPWLWDMDGKKRLYNLHCNGGVFNLGHRNPELIELFKEALETYDIGNHHLMSRTRAELAAELARLMPDNLNYTVFGVGGGEAVDLAFKVARSFTGKTRIISARGGYHGHTGLALAAGDPKYRNPFGPPAPGFEQIPFGDLKSLENAINTDTAAVILETVPATLGILVPDHVYMQGVRKLCDKHKVLLIMDEVQTGLGRTGKLWGFEHFEIVPDIVVLGKGLSGGLYPISATVLRDELESVFHADPFIHISTFGGSEIGCVLARRVLEMASSPEFLSNINNLSELLALEIEKLQKKHNGFLKSLRRLGLMMGLELADELSGPLLTKTAYDNELLIIYANNDTSVCQFLPPLIMEEKDIGFIVAQLDKALRAAKRLKPL